MPVSLAGSTGIDTADKPVQVGEFPLQIQLPAACIFKGLEPLPRPQVQAVSQRAGDDHLKFR